MFIIYFVLKNYLAIYVFKNIYTCRIGVFLFFENRRITVPVLAYRVSVILSLAAYASQKQIWLGGDWTRELAFVSVQPPLNRQDSIPSILDGDVREKPRPWPCAMRPRVQCSPV